MGQQYNLFFFFFFFFFAKISIQKNFKQRFDNNDEEISYILKKKS